MWRKPDEDCQINWEFAKKWDNCELGITGRRMTPEVVARVKAAALAVLLDDDCGVVFRARAVVDFHAR
jgi:hypothetical protein